MGTLHHEYIGRLPYLPEILSQKPTANMADQSSFRRILTTMQNTVQGRNTIPTGTNALQNQASKMEGWLKKQGGIVKSWHHRWFTIKGDQLYYYATNDEGKPPLGQIFLPGNRVVELPNNPSDPDKFLFEIVAGGDRNRMTMTHETYPICASSDDERKAWVHAIKKVMFYDKGGAIFGLPLEEAMAYESLKSKRKIPRIVEMCVDFILQNGVEVEGIFRLPGRSSFIKRMKEEFDSGVLPEFKLPEYDVHSVASLLKLYLRELPSPLIPISFYERVMKIVTRDFHQDPEGSLENLAVVLKEIPRHNYNLLQYLSHFLHEVSANADVNRMPVMNLATVFVQNNIIQPELDDAVLLMGTANGRTQVAFLLITNYDKLFKMEYNTKGVSVQVDTLLDLDMTNNTFRAETTSNALPESSNDLLDIDLSGGLPSPMAPDMPQKEEVDGVDGVCNDLITSVDSLDVQTDGMDDLPEHADDLVSPVDSSLSPSQSSFTEVTGGIPSDMTTSWSCSSYDIGSYPNTPSQSYPGTPSSETQPPPRPPRPVPRSRSSQEVTQEAVAPTPVAPTPPARPPIPPHTSDAPRPTRPAPVPRGPPARASLSSSSVSTESVDTIDSGHVDTEEDDDDGHLDQLLNISLESFTREQLLAHVERVHEELRSQRARNHALQASKIALKNRHKADVLDLAKKIDSEKTATANAVQRVIELQGKLQQLELRHGNLV